jgi:hypothetical protein
MNREREPRKSADPSGRTFDAFEELQRRGINPFLLCGAVCSVERVWKLIPGNKLQAMKKKGFSIGDVRKLPERLLTDASLLRRLIAERFFSLPDYGHISLCGLLESAAFFLRENFRAQSRQSWQNIYAVALIELIGNVNSVVEWAGCILHNKSVEQSQIKPNQTRVPVLSVYKLASKLMREGVPGSVLAAMRTDFPDAEGRVLDFLTDTALEKRFQRFSTTVS